MLDVTDGSPVAFVSVVVEGAESGEQVTGTLSGEDGRFLVQGLAPAEYTIATSVPGFYSVEIELFVGELNESFDLGDIRLERLPTFEEEIIVTAEAIRTAGIDTQVFRLDEGPAQSTGSLLDAMRNLPGVTVDQEGMVSLRGSDRVAILIDGRQSSLTGFGNQRGLDSVSAANVEAIEIIHNPSARFDAAGMAGIINIIYRQEQELGLSGDVGLSMGLGQFSRQRADLPTELGSFANNPKAIPSVNLNYNTPNVRTFVQGELLLQDDLPNNEFTTRFYDDGRVIESQVPENREQAHYIIRLGSDWRVDDANTFSVSGIYDFETHTDRAEVPFILAATGARERFWFWREQEDTGFANISFDLKHAFGTPGHELGVNLQYTRGWEDEAYFLNEVSRVREGTDMTHLQAVSYVIPSENIYYTDSDRYEYFEVFPNVRLTYRLNRTNRVVAAYNRRVDRPGEAELRIFPKYDDPELLKVGNPFLRPQFTNAVEIGFGHSWASGSVTTALYHRDIADSFFRVFAIDDSNPNYDVVNRIFDNAGNSAHTGVEVLVEHEITEPWQVSGSVNWFKNRIDAFETTLLFPTRRRFSLAASKDDTWDVTVNNQIRLPSALELQLSYIYYGARNVPQGRERARASVDVAVQRPILPASKDVALYDLVNCCADRESVVPSVPEDLLDGIPVGKVDLGAGPEDQQLRRQMPGDLVQLLVEENLLVLLNPGEHVAVRGHAARVDGRALPKRRASTANTWPGPAAGDSVVGPEPADRVERLERKPRWVDDPVTAPTHRVRPMGLQLLADRRCPPRVRLQPGDARRRRRRRLPQQVRQHEVPPRHW